MEQSRFVDARNFVYSHARLLEQRLFEVVFEDASPDGVVAALRAYGNSDGGFGHGLEPDKRVPHSQPLDVQVAFQVMEAAGAMDHDLVMGACDFLTGLGSGVGCLRGPFSTYPHAPHWEEWATKPSLNPTAGIVGALWRWGVDHPWRAAATTFCWTELQRGLPTDAHAFANVLDFLASVPQRSDPGAFIPMLGDHLGSLSMFNLSLAADGYGLTPLHFAPAPDSPWAYLFDDAVINAHLDALERNQQPDGGWPITWETLSLTACFECRGAETLRALQALRNFGRLGPSVKPMPERDGLRGFAPEG